jgi:hypothetical protein
VSSFSIDSGRRALIQSTAKSTTAGWLNSLPRPAAMFPVVSFPAFVKSSPIWAKSESSTSLLLPTIDCFGQGVGVKVAVNIRL